ncbi:hypothetical protein F0562_022324 [Nyssa sinensis]|uniref:Uncharacterized protein n=1 Tax=Nyssa sinensis TaxID=561372 RepID=A0A5J5BRC0_9ASTE|nr:hypothetical protein F0562_022324 [Nyssa sinensis]
MASPMQIVTGIVASVIMGVVVWLFKRCFYDDDDDDTISSTTSTQSAGVHTNAAATPPMVPESQFVAAGVRTNAAPTPLVAPENQSVVVRTNTVSAGVLTNIGPMPPMMLENGKQHTIELVGLWKILNDFMTDTSSKITNIMEDVVSLTDVVKINLKCSEDDVAFIRKILDDFMTDTSSKITNIMEDVVFLTDVVKINLKCLEDDVAFVKKSVPVHSGAIREGEETYLAAPVEIKPDVTEEVPDEVADLLKEFADVMPLELPKSLLRDLHADTL